MPFRLSGIRPVLHIGSPMKHVSSDFGWFILAVIATMLAVPIACCAGIFNPPVVTLSANGNTLSALGTVTGSAANDFGTASSSATAAYDGDVSSVVIATGTSSGTVDAPPGIGRSHSGILF